MCANTKLAGLGWGNIVVIQEVEDAFSLLVTFIYQGCESFVSMRRDIFFIHSLIIFANTLCVFIQILSQFLSVNGIESNGFISLRIGVLQKFCPAANYLEKTVMVDT